MIMARWIVALCLSLAAFASAWAGESSFDFDFTSIEGEPMPMSQYRGQPVLLVNTASFCGFTPQYEALQTLWETYRERGLVVLGVPSNDFGAQEPHGEAAIKDFCEANYQVDFPMTTKQVVKGAGAHPLYRWIADRLGAAAAPRWNFHKYLLDRDGAVVGAWPSQVRPLDKAILEAVERAL
jgi:glutathione peroxidase